MVQGYQVNRFQIDFSFYAFAAAFLLLVPLRLALAWLLAVAVHELCHILALRLFRIPINSVVLRGLGMIIDTGSMTRKQEFICALAGPLGGLCLLLTVHWLPYTAICGFIQSGYNLLPIFPLDGGRALQCVLITVFGQLTGQKIIKMFSYGTVALLTFFAVYIALRFDLGVLPVCFVFLLGLKAMDGKIPCKPFKQIVQ